MAADLKLKDRVLQKSDFPSVENFSFSDDDSLRDSDPIDIEMSSAGRNIILGICAMAKKVQSKPMTAILKRLQRFSHIKIVIFDENFILNEEVEKWPIADAMMSFYSHGFPLEKAIAYADLRKPYLINNLRSQYLLMDRQNVYEVLMKHDIPVVRHALLTREDSCIVNEQEDMIEVNGQVFHKPFVEKPVDAEDHNIYIYFPSSAGGGSVRLFRKIGDRSSTYHTESRIREFGSYIYEDFMPTDGTDVKVYAIGAEYAHAEARKSPALDGKVERDSEGKEMRYPIILSAKEKIIAKKVVDAFKQNICGFDLLRANGQSYVCDVNGFSFVKSSKKYYDDCAFMLCVMVTSAIAPQLSLSIKYPKMDKPPLVRTTFGTVMELRSVIGVIRHGDRTPKQKMKCQVFDEQFFMLFVQFRRSPTSLDAKIKKPKGLQQLLNIARGQLLKISRGDKSVKENKGKLEQLKLVLEMYGHFSGINRKAQMKYCRTGQESLAAPNSSNGHLQLIVKWGGELTDEGRRQAENLGRAFRVIYPGGESYSQKEGLGLLRLHSTYRHDLKIYASDEGRVQTTAAAFAKGFLDLEGPLTPILVQMVKSANTNGLLDSDNDCRKYQQVMKEKIKSQLGISRDWTSDEMKMFAYEENSAITEAMTVIHNPRHICRVIYSCMHSVSDRLHHLHEDREWASSNLYHCETWELALQRWRKLLRDFMPNEDEFDFTKIPDIYDNIKYDMLHNQNLLDIHVAKQLHYYAKHMADIVIPSEYGVTKDEKLVIAQRICTPLMKKILVDSKYATISEDDGTSTRLCADFTLNVTSPERFVRTRLYFTSESHIHSLLACLRFGGLADNLTDEQWARAMQFCDSVPELDYLSQIVFMIYEDPSQDILSENRYHVELHFSPGTINLESDITAAARSNSYGFRPKNKRSKAELSASTSLDYGLNTDVGSTPASSDPNTPAASSQGSDTLKQKFGRFEASTVNTSPNKLSSSSDKMIVIKLDTDMSPNHSSDGGHSQPLSDTSINRNTQDEHTDTLTKSDRQRKKKYDVLCHSDSCLNETFKICNTLTLAEMLQQQQQPDTTVATDLHSSISNIQPVPSRGSRDRKNSWSLDRSSDPHNIIPSKFDAISSSQYNTYHGADLTPFDHAFLRNCLKGAARRNLFSTKVIMGGTTGSQPDLHRATRISPKSISMSPSPPKITEESENQEADMTLEDLESGQIHLTTVPSVPEIYPLETLHNSLTLNQLERFLLRLTQNKLHTPWASPRQSLNLG